MRRARRRSLRQGRDVMPYWPPDTPPAVPEQMPQATTPGPAPVPYGGPGFAVAPDMLAPVPDVSAALAEGTAVVHGTPGPAPEAPLAAPNANPYEAGGISALQVPGRSAPGGPDTRAGSVSRGCSRTAPARRRTTFRPRTNAARSRPSSAPPTRSRVPGCSMRRARGRR